jgi:MFS family permease
MHGLYLLWWVQVNHIPAVTVAVSLAAGDLALLALEVPTGWFADAYGHRTSLIAGSAVQIAGMLACWLAPGVGGVFAANLLVALGDAFRSGADQALLFRTCLALDCAHEFPSREARSLAWRAVALLLELMAGGLIVQRWGFNAGWMSEVTVCAIGLTIACLMIEPPPAVPLRQSTDGASAWAMRDRTRGFRGGMRTALAFAALVLPAALVASGHSATSFLVQTAGGREAGTMTRLVAAIVLAEALGSAVAARVRTSGIHTQIAIGTAGVCALAIGAAAPQLLVVTALVLALLDGLAMPLRSAAIQRLARDRVRARAASIASACDMAVKAIALPLAGAWRRTR